MRFATDKILRKDSIFGMPGSYLNDTEVVPNTRGLSYPQDQRPAGMFGPDGVDPTMLPQMRDGYMRSPSGGVSRQLAPMMDGYGDNIAAEQVAQLAPSMIGNFVDHPAVQDTGLPYIMTPNLQKLRRETMNEWQEMPVDMLRHFGIKGV